MPPGNLSIWQDSQTLVYHHRSWHYQCFSVTVTVSVYASTLSTGWSNRLARWTNGAIKNSRWAERAHRLWDAVLAHGRKQLVRQRTVWLACGPFPVSQRWQTGYEVRQDLQIKLCYLHVWVCSIQRLTIQLKDHTSSNLSGFSQCAVKTVKFVCLLNRFSHSWTSNTDEPKKLSYLISCNGPGKEATLALLIPDNVPE